MAASVLIILGALDLGLRLLPLTWFGMTDGVIARRWHPRDAPFLPDLTLRNFYPMGDEVYVGNLPPTEYLGHKLFRTDSHGFRFTPPVRPGQPLDIMVLRGFSFVWGAILNDDETFPSALAQELGMNAYNGSRFHEDDETPQDVKNLLARMNANPWLAVYVHMEPNGHEPSWMEPTRLERACGDVIGQTPCSKLAGDLKYLRYAVATWVRTSPLTLYTTDWYRALFNDRILPNVHRENVASFALPDGRRMLVRRGDLERVQTQFDDATVARRAEYIERWTEGLAGIGLYPLVVLVPEKMTVYGPALGVVTPSDPYLNRLERELRRRGIHVVNVLPELRARAPLDIARKDLMYWREDQHWTPAGVRRMAGFVADEIRRSGIERESILTRLRP